MTCEEIRGKLSEYLDGECDEAEAVAKHLEKCPECQKETERLISLRKELESLVKAPEKSLADSVVAKIRQEKMKKTPFFIRHIGLAASLLIILVLVIYTKVFPYGAKEESAEIGDTSGETVTLEAEILDIKNTAVLRDDGNFSVADASPRDEAIEEEALKEAPLSPNPEYTFASDTLKPIDILSSEFELEKLNENTLLVKTDNLERVRELVGDNYNAYLENGVVVVLLK